METFFQLRKHNTTVGTEIAAGVTTFFTMAYILFVNPQILSSTGMDPQAVFFATCIGAGVITLLMGLVVNFPIALAPGMGLNAYFAVVAANRPGAMMTWETALGAVFISGIVFIILTVTRIRQLLVTAVPDSLKFAITVGIGLFITIIGFKDGGLMTMQFVGDKATQFAPGQFMDNALWLPDLASLHDKGTLLTLIGLLVIGILMALRVPAGILIGIVVTTLIGIPLGITDLSGLSHWSMPNFSHLAVGKLDLKGVFDVGLVTALFTFTFVELFDTFGTLVGTATKAGLLEGEDGQKKIGRAMLVDAIGVSFGALLGTSTITAFVESGSGIAAGGRTGLTAITTGVLFIVSLILSPLALVIPAQATAPALIIVGVLMMSAVKHIDWDNFGIALPAFLTIISMPLTYSISNGIAVGFTSFVIINFFLWLRRSKEYTKIHWLMIIIVILAVWRYGWML
ncbi:xanthine/uracil permease [Alicyclobacillus contaminans]|uniref:NCS2 family permease n=1 Tax=Alicyclobacillus contaminans TaxID=392016 RepID=UPI0003FA4561|nr:NCS2 family permease [Alicyclobacillus contaminans]GMA50328.1 xanthine/uracil permease [Alicyclobacillus contaminans]